VVLLGGLVKKINFAIAANESGSSEGFGAAREEPSPFGGEDEAVVGKWPPD